MTTPQNLRWGKEVDFEGLLHNIKGGIWGQWMVGAHTRTTRGSRKRQWESRSVRKTVYAVYYGGRTVKGGLHPSQAAAKRYANELHKRGYEYGNEKVAEEYIRERDKAR